MTEKRKNVVIDYTARDFHSIRDRLVDHAKKYYPETFQDFSSLSFGSMLVDMVSYIGDQMSLYLDHSVNETFLPTATQYENVVKLGKQMGYKFDPIPAATGLVTLYLAVPPDSIGQGPDFRYAPVLKSGSTFSAPNGAMFTLTSNVDFSNVESTTYIVIEESATTGAPTLFGAMAPGIVVSGKMVTETFTIDAHTPFLKLELENENVSEIVSVEDTEGHIYYEVEYLTQNIIYKQITNSNENTKDTVPMVLRPVAVPRRFLLERDGVESSLRFGYGSETEEEALTTLTPTNVILKQHARDYISNFSFDPFKLLKGDKMGVAPQNTELTVVYRTNGVNVVNVPANVITSVGNTNFRFGRTSDLDPTRMNRVARSLEVTNDEALVGTSRLPSISELKYKILSAYASQNRAVTLRDYKAVTYLMPKRFGSLTRCFVERDADSFKNNINVYVLSEDMRGKLALANITTKENLKTWISKYKTVMDTVDILDGRIVNLGIDFVVKGEHGREESLIINSCHNAILEELEDYKLQMGETFFTSAVYKALTRVSEVISVVSVNVYQKFGPQYSDVYYDIDTKKTSDGSGILAEKDVSFEIKYSADDIQGAVER